MPLEPTTPDTWQEALARRLKTLLRTSPIHRLEASKSQREVELAEHDLRALALRVLDAAIEYMGLGGGASREQLIDALEPLIRGAALSITRQRIEAIANLVIDALLNERERRQAFAERYASLEQDRVVHRLVTFHLLREEEQPDGSIVIRATPEGINLYTGMLEYDVEDAQAADEAVLRAQLSRGRLTQAITTARQARLRSIEYEQKIVTTLRELERDVYQVHWVRDGLPMLRAAQAHIGERLKIEQELVASIDRKLDGSETESRRQFASLAETLNDCIGRHMRLERRLIDANDHFLREQERQAFRARHLTPLPHPDADLLRPALELPQRELASVADRLVTWFHAPAAPSIFDLSLLVNRLLAPRRGEGERKFDLEAPDLERLEGLDLRFTNEELATVDALLQTLSPDGESLSVLFERSRSLHHPRSVRHLLVLRVLEAWDAPPGAELRVQSLGDILQDLEFEGDNLHLALPAQVSVEAKTGSRLAEAGASL
jgi:hypothetical protein